VLPVSLVCLVDWFAYCFSHAICIFTRQIKWMDGWIESESCDQGHDIMYVVESCGTH